MDDMDHVQEIVESRRDALLAKRRLEREAEMTAVAPEFRECDECGDDIPAARLKALPTTKYCVDCQSFLENHRH